jgi:hypothetical protein
VVPSPAWTVAVRSGADGAGWIVEVLGVGAVSVGLATLGVDAGAVSDSAGKSALEPAVLVVEPPRCPDPLVVVEQPASATTATRPPSTRLLYVVTRDSMTGARRERKPK